MFEMAENKRELDNNQRGDGNLTPLKKPEVEFGVEPVDGQQNDDNKNDDKKRGLDDQGEDGNLAPLKKTEVEPKVEFGVESAEPEVESAEPMEIDPEDGQIDPEDDGQIDSDGLMHLLDKQLDNQLNQLGEELDEWSVIPTDQSMEQLNQPPMEQQQQPDQLNQPTEQPTPVALVLKQRASLSKDALSGILCLVVVLNAYNCSYMLNHVRVLLETLAKQAHSKQRLRELRIWTEGSIGMWSLHTTVKGILETFTHLLTARSLIIDSDLLGGNTFALGNLTNLCVALRYWPGQPTTRSIRTKFQKLIEKCGVTPERVEGSKLREFSFIQMPFEGFQSLDLSTLEVVRPMDERENYEKHIIPCIGTPERMNILTTYEAMPKLAGELAHQLRCNRECYLEWSKGALLVIWLLQGERHWVKETETTPGKWSDPKTLRYPIPKNVIQMIMFRTSPQDLKAPSKAPVPIKNMGTIIHGAIKDPLVEEWRESRARTDVLRDRQQHLEQQQVEIQRELEKLELDIIRAQEKTTQAEAEAAPILEKMEKNLRKEQSYFHGTAVRPRAPKRTPEQMAEDKEAKKAKKEAKEKAKNQQRKR